MGAAKRRGSLQQRRASAMLAGVFGDRKPSHDQQKCYLASYGALELARQQATASAVELCLVAALDLRQEAGLLDGCRVLRTAREP